MTEKELIDAGFIKEEAPNEETNNGYDYYYYTLDLCEGIHLISSENDHVENDHWVVGSFDIPALKIETKAHLNEFLELVKTLTGCKNV